MTSMRPSWLRDPRRVIFFLVTAFLAATGCDSCCAQDPLGSTGEPACVIRDDCPDGEAFRFGACVLSGCEADTDCCPGTRCRADVNLCFPILLDSEYACEQSSDCQDPAQRCIPTTIGEREPINTCVYELCDGDSACGFGRSCYEGRCVTTAPCGGNCPEGTACDLITGKCAAFPDKSPGCDKACGGNELKIFSDPTTMSGEACCDLACECKTLPPIVPTRFGRYSRVVFASDDVMVSAYDAQFGDLVVAHYKPDGSFSRLDYVDGVPAGAAVVADPSGPRGGIADVGENVGTHTSIAADAQGLARVAYHDEDGKSLKVALQQADGTWRTHFVDGGDADGNVGQFTDIAVGTDGTIFISYLAHNTTLAGIPGKATGIKLAKSRTPNPTSAADWDLSVVDARPITDPCNNTCASGTACVLNSGAPVCLPEASGCSPSCSSSETCVNTGAVTECKPPPLPPESADVPRGRGLYTSITLDGATPVVAYYDAVDGDLRTAVVSGAAPTVTVLDGDGNGGHRSGDVGRFPTVAKIGNNLTVVYEDFGRHELRAWQGAASELGSGGTYTLVDRGQDPTRSGKQFVGAGARLAQSASSPIVVYQDASNNDLKVANFDGTAWVPGTLVTEGAHGYYSDVAVGGGKAYIVSVEARLDDRGIEASRLGLTVQPAP
jgi:hypothetical protein